jgi:hypothetical protein
MGTAILTGKAWAPGSQIEATIRSGSRSCRTEAIRTPRAGIGGGQRPSLAIRIKGLRHGAEAVAE